MTLLIKSLILNVFWVNLSDKDIILAIIIPFFVLPLLSFLIDRLFFKSKFKQWIVKCIKYMRLLVKNILAFVFYKRTKINEISIWDNNINIKAALLKITLKQF